ncbi:MAG: hypothetical protein NTZ78_03820 [Candidatus Aureabacteria bacterium]|nr:hypothetical protein [Candidatus Auribacterota bacterium]
MEKCKFCFTRSGQYERLCTVCGIDKSKSKSELSPPEKLTRYFCRGIRVVGLLSILSAIMVLVHMAYAILYHRTIAMHGMTIPMGILPMLLYAIYPVFLLAFGYALMKYKKWTFYASMIYFPIIIIFSLSKLRCSGCIAGLFELVLFYYIINATSRKILLRGQTAASPMTCV